MQGWEVILIPIVALVVAILASVFRGSQEAKQRNGQRADADPKAERPRQEPSGIDQFLEEIRRRQSARQESARETRKPREEPERAVVVEAPPPQRPIPRRAAREIPVVALAVQPASGEEMNLPEVLPVATPVASLKPPAGEKVGINRARMAALLKTNQGLQMAFVLREIFDEPVCRRRRG